MALTWKNDQAYSGAKLIGWIITVTKDKLYEMVFCPEGTPIQSSTTSEQDARNWVENEFRKLS